MRSFIAILGVAYLGAGCNANGFTGESAKGAARSEDPASLNGNPGADDEGGQGDANDGVDGDGDADGALDSGEDGDGADVDGSDGSGQPDSIDESGLGMDEDGTPCLKKLVPLRVMFVLDVTESMDGAIGAVKKGVVGFAEQLKSMDIKGTSKKISDVKVGAIAYVDQASANVVIPMQDPASFSARVAKLDTRGGIQDHCEGGLQAAEAAMKLLATEAGSKGDQALPLMIVISDNYSHDGKGASGSRKFDSGPLRTLVGKKSFKHGILFDAVPTNSNIPDFTACPGKPKTPPSAQWTDVRKAWSKAHPKASSEPGEGLGFPFNANALQTTLPERLGKLIRVCGG